MLKNYERAKLMQPEALRESVANYDNKPVFTENGVVYKLESFENGAKKTRYMLTSYDGKTTSEYPEGEKLFKPEIGTVNPSPDGKLGVLLKDHDLWLKDMESGEETQLTFDGELHYDYASRYEGDDLFITDKRKNIVYPPMARWSPDGTRFITYKLDQRKVKDLYLLQNVPEDGSMRPILHTYKNAFAGDEELPMIELYVFDVKTKKGTRVDVDGLHCDLMPPVSPYGDSVSWSKEGNVFTCYDIARDYKKVTVYLVDAATGAARKLFTEETDTFLFFDFMYLETLEGGAFPGLSPSCMNLCEKTDTLIWYSNRDGWYHFYAYRLSDGSLINQITKGEFETLMINRLDWETGKLWFCAAGLQKDLYDRSLCTVNLDGSGFEVVSKEEGNHTVNFAPNGDCYTDLLTEADLPAGFTLRNLDGSVRAVLAECDLAPAKKNGFITPIRFSLPGADGKTPIFGVLLLPEEAQKGEKVPLLEYYYGGNQTFMVPHDLATMIDNPGFIECTAQLGMAVVVIDGMGTPFRGKAFHDKCHKNVGAIAGVEDHIAVIKQLGKLYPVLDLDRVGMWGHSGGGFAALHCMTEYGDFYKCAISSAGNHAQEVYSAGWSERFMNAFDAELWKKQDAEYKVDQLKGPLLLIHGELDDNVHPANTMRVVDQLIKANKDFEFLIVPNYPHGLRPLKYWRRRIFDFFVRNLVGKEPPKEFEL